MKYILKPLFIGTILTRTILKLISHQISSLRDNRVPTFTFGRGNNLIISFISGHLCVYTTTKYNIEEYNQKETQNKSTQLKWRQPNKTKYNFATLYSFSVKDNNHVKKSHNKCARQPFVICACGWTKNVSFTIPFLGQNDYWEFPMHELNLELKE